MNPGNFHLVVVDSDDLVRAFLDFPSTLYKSDKNWIRPLDREIEKVFDPLKNPIFISGGAIRWLLYDSTNRVAGRIGAFYDRSTISKYAQPTGGIGFFDCINNEEAAHALFDAGKTWLAENGMEAMDGPVNWGDRNSFWGCLSFGFHEPVYNKPYNAPYYPRLFESYGFKNHFKQYTYHLAFQRDPRFIIIKARTNRLLKDPGYRFEILNRNNNNNFEAEVIALYKKVWSGVPGISHIIEEQANTWFNSLKPILNKHAVMFAYYNNEPIAFSIMIPDMNQVIRKFNGKLNGFNKLRLFFQLKMQKKCTRLIGLVLGVIPEYRDKGIESALLARFENEMRKKRYRYSDLELNCIGDFNPPMIAMFEHLGGEIFKTYITYRYLFKQP